MYELASFFVFCRLFFNGKFVYQVGGTGILVYNEQAVADVEGYVSAVVGVEQEVAHGAFPTTVEVEAYQFAVLVFIR